MGRNHSIDVNHTIARGGAKTTPREVRGAESKTATFKSSQKQAQSNSEQMGKQSISRILKPQVALGTASKINSFVGELSGMNVRTKNVNTGLAYASILAYAVMANPVTGAIAGIAYTANKVVNYQIGVFKGNIQSDYLRDVSGGIYDNSRF